MRRPSLHRSDRADLFLPTVLPFLYRYSVLLENAGWPSTCYVSDCMLVLNFFCVLSCSAHQITTSSGFCSLPDPEN
jgi:hypothetical protein